MIVDAAEFHALDQDRVLAAADRLRGDHRALGLRAELCAQFLQFEAVDALQEAQHRVIGDVKLEVTGDKIEAALENGFSQVREVGGRFPQVSGMEIVADLDQPPGDRVVSVTIGGAPLDPARTYTLATNDFMARGGDGYKAFIGAKMLIDPAGGVLMASQVIDHVAAASTVEPKVEGRIKLE